MQSSPLSRLTPFAGVGVGGGFALGCGVGAGSGTGGQGTPPRFSSAPPSCVHVPRARPPLPSSSSSSSSSASKKTRRPFAPPVVAAEDAEWTRKRVHSAEYDALRPTLPRRTRAHAPAPPESSKTEACAKRARQLLAQGAKQGAGRERAVRVPNLVAVRFTWEGAARRAVFLAGSFNAWGMPVPLRQSGAGWARVVRLPVGTHYYRFVVDGEWKVDEERRVVLLRHYGRVNELCIAQAALK